MIDSADNATSSLPVTEALRLHFCDAARSTFTVDLGQDLLGHWVLTMTWNDVPQQRVGGKRLVVDGHEAGLKMLQEIARKKERSGFWQVPYHVRSHS